MADVTIGDIAAAAQALGPADVAEIEQSVSAVPTSAKTTLGEARTFMHTLKHMVPIMAGSMRPRSTNGCAALAATAAGAGQPDIVGLDFDSAAAEYAHFAIPMPSSWDEGSVTFRPVWRHGATATNFGVTWKLRAVAVGNDDSIAAAFGTAQSSSDTGGTTDDLYVGPESSAITIAGAPVAGDVVFFEVYRDPPDGSDSMGVDARLIGIELLINVNAAGDA